MTVRTVKRLRPAASTASAAVDTGAPIPAPAPTAGATEAADEPGLRLAFLAHGGELYGYARRSLGDAGAAEDVVQETFVRAWKARDRFDTNLGTLRTWLFTIARRVVIDHARARAVRQSDPFPAEVAVAEDEMERAMVAWQVEEAVRRLRPEHREVLVETYYRGRSGREVAEALGVPEGTVRSRLFYALRTLRLTLDEMGWER
ncbi:MAG TPA: sigma-70 family RNA polymerase sigma factor [Acidimicrobiales bacterium]|nr:sigma-70 family RNA polymerase sigma factor [Acidimicrobiales bacterium]